MEIGRPKETTVKERMRYQSIPLDPISLILVAHNEALTVEREITSLQDEIVRRIPRSEFIVAEDGSTDGTTQIVKRLAKELGVIHLSSEKRRGYRNAFLEAVSSAKNDYIFFCDSGLKYDAKDFWKLYDERLKYDLIVGRRTNRQDQAYRRLLTYAYNLLLRAIFCLKDVQDADGGFRLFNGRVVESILKKRLEFDQLIGSEIVIRANRAGLRYREVPVAYFRRIGTSRGLPATKIPRVIVNVLNDLRLLRSELLPS